MDVGIVVRDVLSVWLVVFLAREVVTMKKLTGLRYLLTPLVTVLAVALALLSMQEQGVDRYRLLVLSGLILSLVADTIIMVKEVNLLPQGIVYFMAAHCCYIAAFSSFYEFSTWHIAVGIAVGVFAAGMFLKMKGRTGGLDIPILVYVLMISAMVYFAWAVPGEGRGLLTLAGATLFMISDAIIAVNAFVRPIPHDSAIVWAFYAPAQVLIAASCFVR